MRIWAFVGRFISTLLRLFVRRIVRDTDRARVIVRSGDHILLLQDWLSTQKWSLPGGGIHSNESAQHAAARELAEETGVIVPSKDIEFIESFATTTGSRAINYRAALCEVRLSKKVQPRARFPEVLQVRWFRVDALPENRDSLIDTALEKSRKHQA